MRIISLPYIYEFTATVDTLVLVLESFESRTIFMDGVRLSIMHIAVVWYKFTTGCKSRRRCIETRLLLIAVLFSSSTYLQGIS